MLRHLTPDFQLNAAKKQEYHVEQARDRFAAVRIHHHSSPTKPPTFPSLTISVACGEARVSAVDFLRKLAALGLCRRPESLQRQIPVTQHDCGVLPVDSASGGAFAKGSMATGPVFSEMSLGPRMASIFEQQMADRQSSRLWQATR